MKAEKAEVAQADPVTGAYSPEVEKILDAAWDSVTICNDFIFCKVMQDESLLAELIRRILPQLKFTTLRIESQHTIEIGMDIHGVRFDVYVTLEDGSVVDIEMQATDTGCLPRRARYYISMADMELLEKGVVYSKLKDSYVILITPFDLFGQGRHVYTFTNRCKEDHSLEMGDGTTKIFLNAAGTLDDVHGGLEAFLDYVAGKPVNNDDYVAKLDAAVRIAKANKEWRLEYMTVMMRDLENQEKGIEIGLEQGIGIGKSQRDREKIADMLRKGKTPEAIADFCDYPSALVQEVQQSMLAAR